jgi:hypothetical protein
VNFDYRREFRLEDGGTGESPPQANNVFLPYKERNSEEGQDLISYSNSFATYFSIDKIAKPLSQSCFIFART